MIKRLILYLSLAVIGSHSLHAGTVSFDQLATSSDLTVAKYNSDLNTIFQDHNSNIQSSNIAADTVAEVDMADDANPRLRDYELGGSGTECEMVYTGLLSTTTSGTLTGSIPSGTAYPRGYRVVKSSATPKTFTANRWTFVDLDINGNFTYSEVAIAGATPSVAPNSIRLSRVSTDGTQVGHVQDLRTLSCTSAKISSVKESANEATLANILNFGREELNQSSVGHIYGAQISWDTHTTFTVRAGSAYFSVNNEFRAKSTDTTVPMTADDPANGVSGIDTGAIAAGTPYFVYLAADQTDVASYTAHISTSGTAPTGLTNFRLIGKISTDATSLFTSGDIVTTHSPKAPVQIVYYQDSAVATGSTVSVADNSIPLQTEGTQFMAASITPQNVNNRLRIDVVFNGGESTNTGDGFVIALHQDSTANAIAAINPLEDADTASVQSNAFTHWMTAGTVSKTTFKVRAGTATGETTFNGINGTRQMGGVMASSITITEYEF